MSNVTIALMQLDGLIAGMEANSEIPVQLSELKMLKQLLTTPQPLTSKIDRIMQSGAVGYVVTVGPDHGPDITPVTREMLYKDPSEAQPPLRAVPLSLFPTMHSLQAVVDLAYSQLPVIDKNTMHGLLMSYHNTLLSQLNQTKE